MADEDGLKDRIEDARAKRQLPPREGHEITAGGKEVPTPNRDDFFGNLEKASYDDPETLPHPRRDQNGE